MLFRSTLEPDILQRNICSYTSRKIEILGCELRYLPFFIMFFTQNIDLLLPVHQQENYFKMYNLLPCNQ